MTTVLERAAFFRQCTSVVYQIEAFFLTVNVNMKWMNVNMKLYEVGGLKSSVLVGRNWGIRKTPRKPRQCPQLLP